MILVCGTKEAAFWGAADLSYRYTFVFSATKFFEKMLIFHKGEDAAHTGCQKECVPE